MGEYNRGFKTKNDDKIFRDLQKHYVLKTIPYYSKASIAKLNDTTRQNVGRIETTVVKENTVEKMEAAAVNSINKILAEAIIKLLDVVDPRIP